jgi:Zn-dependent metalloprotease
MAHGCAALLLVGLLAAPGAFAADGRAERVGAASGAALAGWSSRVDDMLRSQQLVPRLTREDAMIAGRRHERLAQHHLGVPVFGGELVRQSDLAGTVSVFGTLYEGVDVSTTPALRSEDAEARVAAQGGRPFGRRGGPELVVLPVDSGYRLAWRLRAFFARTLALRQVFLDAATGATLLEYDDAQRQQAAVGTGVFGDQKKLSVSSSGSSYTTEDRLRPPLISTYDFRFDTGQLIDLLDSSNPLSTLSPSELGRDSDNVWTDGALVDAHVYAGYTYDYYFKRHGRRGLDNSDIPVHSITHALRREDWVLYDEDVVGSYFANAFYFGDGIMYYGDGLPPSVNYFGQRVNYLAGSLDIVAHELTHGVTDYSSGLIYLNESGALNEAFSDMMATATEFEFQPERADYLMGEDVFTPGGIRSMQNPRSFGDPDHYSIRFTGTQDGGGVHINSGIPNHAFYLAIEGGRHRLGATVQGVGAANRAQIERVFYRAFTSFLAPSATFSQARAATIQAARELYGIGGAVETAVTQAWDAVGVN